MSKIADEIKNLPQAPGVYFFRDLKGKILYIGKATNLKTRVQSYFRSDIAVSRSEWIGQMISQVANVDFEQTDSVLEALILESNLIKKYQPKYNTLEKDDKSFSYFVITKEEFPRVIILRETDLLKISNKYLCHPALDAGSSKSHQLIRNLDSRFHGNDKGLQLCDKNKKFKYADIVAGKTFGPYTSKQQMQVALKIIRRIFPFHALKQKTEKGCLDFQIGMCPGPYADAISKVDYKKNIRGIEMILQGKKKSLVSKLEKEMLLHAKKDEFEKAAVLRNKIFALQHIRDVALMTRDMETPSPQPSPRGRGSSVEENFRIEAYDISNISGQHAVGSMVVFENGQSNKSQYRKFKIKTVDVSNDVAMMKEVLSRRFNNDWAMPDLILLDGGLGHLNMAIQLLHEELELAVAIAGVAKGPTRKKLDINRDENLQKKSDKQIEDILENDNLIKSIMDEAHRFAIGYHRKLRSKSFLQ